MKGSRGHYHALPIIASPLQEEGEEEHGHGHGHEDHSYTQTAESKGLVHEVSPLAQDDVPVFREKEEANTIELFYDLFFVANLTSFTNIHPITDHKGMLPFIHYHFFFVSFGIGEKLTYIPCTSHRLIYGLLLHPLVYLASSRPLRCPIWSRFAL